MRRLGAAPLLVLGCAFTIALCCVTVKSAGAASTIPPATVELTFDYQNSAITTPGSVTSNISGATSGAYAYWSGSTAYAGVSGSSTGNANNGGYDVNTGASVIYYLEVSGPTANGVPIIVTATGSASTSGTALSYAKVLIAPYNTSEWDILFSATAQTGVGTGPGESPSVPSAGFSGSKSVSIVPGTVYYLNTTTYISIGEYAGSGGASVDPMVAIDPTFAKASDYTLTLSPDLSPGPPKPTSGSIHLSSGWNLVSLPAQPSNTAIASVLSGIKGTYEVVWAYPNQAWQVYDPYDTVGSTLTKMQAGMGYWIKMSSAKTLSVSGLTPSPSISLASGWNLVGYNGASCATASTALSGLTGLQVSWGYPSQGWQFYDPANSSASGLTQLCPGAGYWVDVNGAATWSGW